MGPLCTVIFTLGLAYQLYRKAKSENKWSWTIFFGTLGGIFAMAIVLLTTLAFVVSGPKKDQGLSLLALAVAYVMLLIALICYSTRAYKRLLKQRGLVA